MSMVDIEIRDVPQELWDSLMAGAEARGLSVQDFLLALMEEAAQRYRMQVKRERPGWAGGQ